MSDQNLLVFTSVLCLFSHQCAILDKKSGSVFSVSSYQIALSSQDWMVHLSQCLFIHPVHPAPWPSWRPRLDSLQDVDIFPLLGVQKYSTPSIVSQVPCRGKDTFSTSGKCTLDHTAQNASVLQGHIPGSWSTYWPTGPQAFLYVSRQLSIHCYMGLFHLQLKTLNLFLLNFIEFIPVYFSSLPRSF